MHKLKQRPVCMTIKETAVSIEINKVFMTWILACCEGSKLHALAIRDLSSTLNIQLRKDRFGAPPIFL